MSDKLKDKVAVVTGGGSGIGLAIAKAFADEGARVAITGRTQKKLDTAIKEIGRNSISVSGDIASVADLKKMFQTVSSELGRIDILVANAGVLVIGALQEFTEEMFDKVSDINFKGTFFSVQQVLPVINDGGSIILVSSTVNQKGVPNHAAYSASKAAVRSLARSFSADLLPRKIRVNALTPGPIDTPVFSTVTNSAEEARGMAAAMANFTPIKRLGHPGEIAAAAVYLASDDSAFMLGAELLLDGGLRDL